MREREGKEGKCEVKEKASLKRILSAAVSLMLVASLLPALPVPALASSDDKAKAQVHVIVDNTAYTKAEGAAWDGVLVDTWVDITENMKMKDAVVAALDKVHATQEGAENGYISSINGLEAGEPNSESGWMGTQNDWFVNFGFNMIQIEDNDELHVFFSKDGGIDHGGTWNNNETTVKDIAFSAGSLDKPFSSDVDAYTLIVPAGVTSVKITPTATNKNYQVRTFIGDTSYKRTESVPVENGTVITVKCGDPEWPSMNASAGAHTYTFTVSQPTKGDVNNSNCMNIIDAQIVYDLSTHVYGDDYAHYQLPSSWTYKTLMWVADVNDDDVIDASDALAIQSAIHSGAVFA